MELRIDTINTSVAQLHAKQDLLKSQVSQLNTSQLSASRMYDTIQIQEVNPLE